MNKKRVTDADSPAPATGGSPAGGNTSLENTAGRVRFDSRGNAVWEWRAGDGEFQQDASTSMVRSLEPEGLSLESTTKIQRLIAKPSDGADADHDAKAEPWGHVRGHANSLEGSPKGGQAPESGQESAGFDPYNSGRSVSHVRKAARRPVAKPAAKPAGPERAEPERKGLLARLTGRKP